MTLNVYAVATPFVLALALLEFAYCAVRKNGYYGFQDSIASFGTAILNQCVNVGVAFLVLPLFGALARFSLWHLGARTPLELAALFLGVDFLFYWFHRFGHRTNIGWAAHAPHHSTEELNYAVALRASVTQRLFSFLFYWPMVLVGFSPDAVVAMVAFHLVLQFIPHTRVVPRLPRWIESWMNTPSHHRVHHARNDCYIDKNYGGFLIIWDKLFGSYADEVEPCSYGVTAPPNTWDPTIINFQTWSKLVSDAMATKDRWDQLRIWVMPTGWRPADLSPRPPAGWRDGTRELKFRSTELSGVRAYLVVQLVCGLVFMLLVSHHASPFSSPQKIGFTLELWAMATAWAAMLESRSWALGLETLRVAAIWLSLSLWLAAGAMAPLVPVAAGAWTLASVTWLAWIRERNAAPVGTEA